MVDIERMFKKIPTMRFAKDMNMVDFADFINIQENPEEFCVFVKELHEEIINHFGPTTTNHLVLFKSSPDCGPESWELLLEIDNQRRLGEFVDKLNEFEFPRLNDFPVDLCRYSINRRKIGGVKR